jgi:hypothetical protein
VPQARQDEGIPGEPGDRKGKGDLTARRQNACQNRDLVS